MGIRKEHLHETIMKTYKHIILASLCFILLASCGNGFYRQTPDSKYRACVVNNQETIKAVEDQCNKDKQRGCRKQVVTWICESRWRK